MSDTKFSEEYLQTDEGQFLAWAHESYRYELDQQIEGRAKRSRDESFYDGDQFVRHRIDGLEIYRFLKQ